MIKLGNSGGDSPGDLPLLLMKSAFSPHSYHNLLWSPSWTLQTLPLCKWKWRCGRHFVFVRVRLCELLGGRGADDR